MFGKRKDKDRPQNPEPDWEKVVLPKPRKKSPWERAWPAFTKVFAGVGAGTVKLLGKRRNDGIVAAVEEDEVGA